MVESITKEFKRFMTRGTKINKENIKCNICGKTESSQWLRQYDKNENWDGKSFLCKSCYNTVRYPLPKGYIEKYQEYRDKKYKKRICCNCGSDETYIDPNGYTRWHKSDKGALTGFLCHTCYGNDYQHNDPNSSLNTKKGLANRRTGNISRDSQYFLEMVSQAVVAKYLGVEDLNIKMDNFNWYIDIEYNKEKINVKAREIDDEKKWNFHTKKDIKPDTYYCLGFSKNLENIDVAYIVPNEGWVCSLDTLGIYKDAVKSVCHDPYNDLYQNLRQFLKDKKYIGIDDIKEWFRRN